MVLISPALPTADFSSDMTLVIWRAFCAAAALRRLRLIRHTDVKNRLIRRDGHDTFAGGAHDLLLVSGRVLRLLREQTAG